MELGHWGESQGVRSHLTSAEPLEQHGREYKDQVGGRVVESVRQEYIAACTPGVDH